MVQNTNIYSDQKVRYGTGLRYKISDEINLLGCRKALVLSTPEQSQVALDIASGLGDYVAGIYSKAAMHTPMDVTDDALIDLEKSGADCLIAVGGGSTTGLGKALSMRTGLPQIVVPTTYAGSEATPILGQTENGIKTTFSDPRILPKIVLYDPELVVSLPTELTVTSALNAMAHAIEALYAKDRTDKTTELAVSGLKSFQSALPLVLEDPRNLSAREETLRGAWACGTVLGLVGMALHHKLCHTLGGSFNLPHAQTHAIILPHATAFNAKAAHNNLHPITEIFGGTQPGQALWDFAKKLGAPLSLQKLGLRETDLDKAAEIATQNPYWNPRPIDQQGVRALLENAWSGSPPSQI